MRLWLHEHQTMLGWRAHARADRIPHARTQDTMASMTRNIFLATLMMALIASAHAQPTIRLPVLRTPTAELVANAPRFTTGRKLLQTTLAPAIAVDNTAATPLASQPLSAVPVVLPTTLLRSAVGAPSSERTPTGMAAGQLAGALAALEAVRAEGK